jgi:VanZ family protein
MRVHFQPRYGLCTVAYLAAIYWLSSMPDLGGQSGLLVRFLLNVGHAPLFAGLAVCVLKSLSPPGETGWGNYALAFAMTGACGVLDEWHQSFVPGRQCSLRDLAVDLVGIAGLLLLTRLHARRSHLRPPVTPPMSCVHPS